MSAVRETSHCEVSRSAGVRVTGKIRTDIFKDHNFDYGETIAGIDLGIFAELHRYGYARDYVVQGSPSQDIDFTVP